MAKGKLLSQNAAQLVGNLMFDFRLVTPGLRISRLGTPPLGWEPPGLGLPRAWKPPWIGPLGLEPLALKPPGLEPWSWDPQAWDHWSWNPQDLRPLGLGTPQAWDPLQDP